MNAAFFTLILLSIIRLTTPIALAGIGNMFSERVGVLNLGAEGMMLCGAFCGVLGSYLTKNPWLGVLFGILGGVLASSLHALICVEFGGTQAVSGLGLNILAAGLTTLLSTAVFGTNISPSVPSIQTTPFLAGIPIFGGALSQLSPLIYLSVPIIIGANFLIYHTPFGLRLMAVGDDPKTVETAGVDVWKLKYAGVLLCGAFCGLAGAFMSLGQLDRFFEDMISGKGMMAVIVVKMGRWNPLGIVATALMLGFFDALQLQIQISGFLSIPPEITQIIPFVVAIAAISLQPKGGSGPKTVETPYLRNRYKF